MNGEILAIGIVQIYIAGGITFIVIGTIIVIDRFYFKLFLFPFLLFISQGNAGGCVPFFI